MRLGATTNMAIGPTMLASYPERAVALVSSKSLRHGVAEVRLPASAASRRRARRGRGNRRRPWGQPWDASGPARPGREGGCYNKAARRGLMAPRIRDVVVVVVGRA